MNGMRQRKGPVAEIVGALAGITLLAIAVTVGAYFTVWRGPGLRAVVQAGSLLEFGLLCGLVTGSALLVMLRVASAVRQARNSSLTRHLLQQALEADYTSPDVLREFETVPQVRDIVAMLMADKAQGRELGDRVEMLHGELTSLADGMQRTARDLGRMREEGLSAAGARVATQWNQLLERVKQAETAAAPAPVAVPAPARPEITTLVARLDELEHELARLQHAVDTTPPPLVQQPSTPVERAARELVPPPVPAHAGPTLGPLADPWTAVRASASQPVGVDEEWSAAQDVSPKRRVATWNVATPGMLEPTPLPAEEPGAAEVDAAFDHLTVAAGTDEFAPRPRWEASADLFLPEAAGEDVAGTAARTALPAMAPPTLDDTAFPHFVGKPVRPIPDRLAVTYDANQNEEVVDLPASALLFEPEVQVAPLAADTEPIDLRSLGATEFET